MHRLSLLLLATLAAPLPAAVVLTLNPANGQISGTAGSTIGWSFTLTSDTHYLLSNGIDFLPGPSIGTFEDLLSARPTFTSGPLENPVVSEVFDLVAETGLAKFTIDAGTPEGTIASGNLYFNYSLFTVSPNDPLFDPGAHFFDVGLLVLPVQVAVVAAPAVPEPTTWSMAALAFGVAAWRARRRVSSH